MFLQIMYLYEPHLYIHNGKVLSYELKQNVEI